ncbi:Uncharacterised protein [Candidatus Tiddalikarchaeum anstoanum]|nr:Uncharacterised protein [Candidatus Tiddalikarchaeum anstoanum]
MDSLDKSILKLVCSGQGVFVNLYQLSKTLKCHRNSAQSRINDLISRGIILPPFCFYSNILKSYPLFVLGFVNYPVDDNHMNRLVKDYNIVGLFKIRQADYNLLFFGFFKDIVSHKVWEDKLFYQDTSVGDSESIYVPTEFFLKVDFNDLMRRLKEKDERDYIGESLDDLSFNILMRLLNGDFVSINTSFIGKKLGVHRKTVKNRLDLMFKNKIIDNPSCFFPNFFSPPGRLLVVTLIESRVSPQLFSYLKNDPHVVGFAKINKERYTHLLISSHNSIATFTSWSEKARAKFSEIKAAEVIFIPSENVIKSRFDVLTNYLLSE